MPEEGRWQLPHIRVPTPHATVSDYCSPGRSHLRETWELEGLEPLSHPHVLMRRATESVHCRSACSLLLPFLREPAQSHRSTRRETECN
jgi:hypothetical protein